MREKQTHCFLHKARINNMFVSVQGEGPFVGVRQAFIRFAGCNLDCEYCDTDFSENLTCDYKAVVDFVNENMPLHSVSLTGGEPLLQSAFLTQLLPHIRQIKGIKAFLETNGSLPQNLLHILEFIDIVSVDVKLPSVAKTRPLWDEHSEFFSILKRSSIKVVVKAVINDNVIEDDIERLQSMVWDFNENWTLVLQPEFSVTIENGFLVKLMAMQKRFLNSLRDVRIIPQVHKLTGID